MAPRSAWTAGAAATALLAAALGYAIAWQRQQQQLDRLRAELRRLGHDSANPSLGWPALSPAVAPPAKVARRGEGTGAITVRLYSAMSCDLYHYGHSELLRRGITALRKRLGPEVTITVVVGVCSDETVESYKRRPILTLRERAAAMRSCRYCDEVIEDVPAVTDAAFMHQHSIDYVLTGDDYTDQSLRKWFPEAAKRGVCIREPYSRGISTSDIIRRCQDAAPVTTSNIHAA
eukprot:COSAG05_NODE_2057_length_3631_cov_3.848528_4_plen_233_part_00